MPFPTVPLHKAADPKAAARSGARNICKRGQPVAVKILSSDIPHKSDVDGVRLNLTTEADVGTATATVIANARAREAGRPASRG